MSVELVSYHCKPEGGGVFQAYTNSLGAALIKSKTIALVMVGYRNASILLLERGQLTKLKSSNFGFIRLVEEVTKRISTVLDTAALADAIIKANNSQYWSTADDLEQKLVKAIAPAREQYWLALKTWLKDNLPKKLDEVILCGGTAHFMKPELEQHFQHSELIWDGNLKLPDELCGDSLGQRMSDAYGMYLCFDKGVKNAG
jgi:Tfp pilus assembly PilM family ATPase